MKTEDTCRGKTNEFPDNSSRMRFAARLAGRNAMHDKTKYLRIGFEGVFRESYAHFYYEKKTKKGETCMKQRKLLKALSLFLMIVLLSSVLLPFSASAAEEDVSEQDAIPEPTVVPKDAETLQREIEDMAYEVISLREENVKHFRLGDGTYQAVVYGEAVHRKNENGEWVEIDNSLSEINGAIATNDARIKFSKKITGNSSLFTLHEGSYKMTVGLEGAEKKTEATVRDLSEEADSNSTTLEKLKQLSNISAGVLYENILPGTDLEYILRSNYLKENLIVKEPQESYCYTFTLDLSGLIAEMQDGDIVVNDSKTGETVYRIPAPYLYDAAGVYSYDASYALTETGNGKYTYTLTANAEWINSEDRVFPVVIDPMLVDIGQIEDTYASSTAPSTNYGSAHALKLSQSSEVYYKFATPHLPSGVTITQATVKVPYYFESQLSGSMATRMFSLNASWSEKTLKWNNRPSASSTVLGSATLYVSAATITNPVYATYTVTSHVQSWYTGTANNGFVIKYYSGSASEACFPAREKMQKFAQLTIVYNNTHLGEGVFSIRRDDMPIFFEASRPTSTAYLRQDANSFSDTLVPLSTDYLENLFKVSYRPDNDDYVIRSMLDSSIVIYPDTTREIVIVKSLSASDTALSSAYTWKMTYSGGSYYITHTQGEITYYLRSDTTSNNAALRLTTNASDTGIVWSFRRYTGNVYEDLVLTSFKNSVTVGERFQFHANVVSTRIGQNGPVTYQISYLGSSDVADFYPATGILKGNEVCTVSIGMTYNGAPSVWWWVIQIRTAGCKPYYSILDGTHEASHINCQGYAFWTHDIPTDWCTQEQQKNVSSLSDDPNIRLYGTDGVIGIKQALEEDWLNIVFPNRWEEVYSADGGWDVELEDNQWLVAFRVGILMLDTIPYASYHFWYRTNTGEWATKHGAIESQLLGSDLPTDDNSPGWEVSSITSYNSDIIYYVLTEED